MYLHKHACDVLHEELEAQSVAEYLQNCKDPNRLIGRLELRRSKKKNK